VTKARAYSLSSRAIRDLIYIYKYLEDRNPAAGEQLVSAIERKIRDTARLGLTGVPVTGSVAAFAPSIIKIAASIFV
jgi:plasmid stabilization system protein ParE